MLIELIEKDDISNIEIIGSKSLPIYYTKSDLLFFLYDSKYIIYKASLDNIICGFLVGEIHDNRIHIMSIATDIDYRRKNVATNLINKIKEKYNNSIITLFVQQKNNIAISFYKKNNFIAVFEEKNYYNNLQEKDAYFMAFSNNLNN
jgi:ribosomal protein S18 acetylase RimI-like enzyme